MGFDLSIFKDEQLEADYLEWLVDEHSIDIQQHFAKLWEYYANPQYETANLKSQISDYSGRCYVQAQEYGLPARITGLVHSVNTGIFGGRSVPDVQRKEVVIENDIAWRINAAVDFLFGKPISFISKSPNSQKRSEIESILKAVFGANGGIGASPARACLAYLAVGECERVAVTSTRMTAIDRAGSLTPLDPSTLCHHYILLWWWTFTIWLNYW